MKNIKLNLNRAVQFFLFENIVLKSPKIRDAN